MRTERFTQMEAASRRAGERRDCTVRALAVALDVSYARAHDILASLGRKPRRGFPFSQCYDEAVSLAHGRVMGVLLGPELKRVNGGHLPTVRTFPKLFPHGRWMLFVRGHVLAMTNGQVHDWTEGRRHRIRFAVCVSKFSKPLNWWGGPTPADRPRGLTFPADRVS